MTTNVPIGNLLVEAGIISGTTLERALAAQKQNSKRLGEILSDMGVVTGDEILTALKRQYNLRAVPQQKSADRDSSNKKPLGKLLVEAGIISATTLERALAEQKKTGKRLGTLLSEKGIVTEEEILAALTRQNGETADSRHGSVIPQTGGKNQIGDLLVHAGIISVRTLERALQAQSRTGKRLGSLLGDMGIVTEEEVLEALSKQCQLRIIRNFSQQPFPKELLDLVPGQLALEKLIFPLKQSHGMLAVATLDPFDTATFDALAAATGMKIYLALASRNDIFAAITRHYLVGKWATGGRKKILLIEYSPIVTSLLQPPLLKEGYEVLVSHDGIDGLKMVFSHHPDLILCDAAAPRMDGYMLMHAVRAHPETCDIPVVLLSAKNSGDEEHRAHKAGFADFIAKPAMPIRVIVAVKKVLATQRNILRGNDAGTESLPAASTRGLPPRLRKKR